MVKYCVMGVSSEGPAGVLEGVQAAEASLKAAEADMEVALHTLREQLAEAGKHGLGNLVEGFEQKMHSAVADFDTQKGGVAEALDLGKQIVGKYQEAEKRYWKGEKHWRCCVALYLTSLVSTGEKGNLL